MPTRHARVRAPQCTLAFLLLLASPIFCAQKKPITLETLAQAARPGHGAPLPEVWLPDGRSFLTRQNNRLTLYDCATEKARMLLALDDLDAAAAAPTDDGPMDWTNRRAGVNAMQLSADGRQLLYTTRGDIFLIDLDTGKWEQLTRTAANERDARLAPDGRSVAFRRGADLYTLALPGKIETRLTRDGLDTLRNGGLDWVYPEELDLNAAFWWSPDSKSIAYLQFDTHAEPSYPHADLLRLRATYEPERYPKAGDANATIRMGVVPAAGGTTRWFDLGDTHESYLVARAGWMPGSRAVYVLRFNRVQNRDTLFSVDVETGARATIFEESDPYWINLEGDICFLDDGRRFLWTSQRGAGGYRHLFLYSNDGRQVRQLTGGAWEVTGIVAVDAKPPAASSTPPMSRANSSVTCIRSAWTAATSAASPKSRAHTRSRWGRAAAITSTHGRASPSRRAAFCTRAMARRSALIANRTAPRSMSMSFCLPRSSRSPRPMASRSTAG
jgi:dipeptidyl-peptidase-4